MISRLILSKQSYLQLIVVLLGTLFGLLLTMTSIQTYCDFKSVLDERKELISSQFLVLNKSVSIVNTISGEASVFSDEEIQSLRSLKCVEKLGVFKANRFRAQTGIQLQDKEMFTDMFFESVPDDLLDIKVPELKWKPGKPVPIILPTDYLNLYNFGFAPSQGLPQISRGAARLAGLKVVISGKDSTIEFNGSIAGFTDRINTILVPEAFLDYANNTFGFAPEKGVSRLVLMCKDPSDPALLRMIEDRGYETNLEILKNGKIKSLLNLALSIVLLIGSVIILLAILGFIQYAQLLIVSASYEIKTLLHLGYKVRFICMKYMKFYVYLMLGVLILSLAGVIWLKSLLMEVMKEANIEAPEGISMLTYLSAGGLIILYLALNAWNTYRRVSLLAKAS